jgi:hypothetical protein
MANLALEQISKHRSRPSSALYVLLYTAGRRLNGYDVRKSALDDIAFTVPLLDEILHRIIHAPSVLLKGGTANL